MLILPWTRRPPREVALNWGHPLVKGMVGCFHLDAGLPINLVSGAVMTQVATPGFSAADGPARTFAANDSSYFEVTGDNVATSLFNLTGSCAVLTTHLNLGHATVMQPVSRINFSFTGWNVQYDLTNGGTDTYDIELEGVLTGPVFKNYIIRCRPDQRLCHIVWNANATSGVVSLAVNGLPGSAFASVGDALTGFTGFLSNSASKLTIGTDSDAGSSRGCTNPLSRVVIWNRALTPAEMLALTLPQTAYSYMAPQVYPFQTAQAAAAAAQQSVIVTRHLPTPTWRVG